MPTLRALECLVAVVETGSVTAAATRLHASQPAVSHQLTALERELGLPLVERLPRGVTPTVAGRAVLADAVTALAAASRVTEIGHRIAAGRGGVLRIGCAASVLLTVLPPTLRRWHSRHPDVDLTVLEADSADTLVAELVAGRLDVVVAPRPTDPAGRVTTLGTEEIVLAMARDHALAADAGPVAVQALAGQAAVLYPAGHGLGGWVDALLAAHSVAVQPVLRTRQVAGAAALAATGLGIAFVPAGAVSTAFGGVLRPLAPRAARQIVAVTVGDHDVTVRRFVDDLVARGVPQSAAVRSALGRTPDRAVERPRRAT